MAATPECLGCARPAPAPESAETGAWRTSTQPLATICPDRFAAPETAQRVVDEKARADLACAEDPRSSVLFICGVPKRIVDCSREEIEWHADHLQRQFEQDRAWGLWLEAQIAVLEARGEETL